MRVLRQFVDSIAYLGRDQDSRRLYDAFLGINNSLNDINADLNQLLTQLRDNQFMFEHSHAFPGVRLRKAGAISIPNNAETVLDFAVELEDEFDFWESANNTRITFRIPGRYCFGATIAFTADSAGDRGLVIKLNGATNICYTLVGSCKTATNQTRLCVAGARKFARDDYIEAYAFQDSGAPLNIVATNEVSPVFWAFRSQRTLNPNPLNYESLNR